MLLEEGVCYDQLWSLGKTLLTFDLLHFVLQGQTCLLHHVSLDFSIPVPYDEKDIFLFFTFKEWEHLHGLFGTQSLSVLPFKIVALLSELGARFRH